MPIAYALLEAVKYGESGYIIMKALKCKPSACFYVLTEVCLGSRDAMSLCLM